MRHFLHRPLLLSVAVLLLGAASTAAGFAVAHRDGAAASASPRSAGSKPALVLVSSTPVQGATDVAPDATLTLAFSQPLADYSPQPSLNPAVPGTWVPEGTSALQFEPGQGLPPGTTETIEVPGGPSGVVAADGSQMTSNVSLSFSVAPMSLLRTQELLAELGYLPLTWAATDSAPVPPAQMATDQQGTFTWRWTTMPAAFTSLWTAGQSNVITTGAIRAFESQEGLTTDGLAGPQVWKTLLSAVAANQTDPDTDYDWVDVSESLPESLTVWRNGAPVYSTPVNTGIAAAPTALGSYTVYARYVVTTMTGFNPDGTRYSDPGVPWVSYFNGGDALHGFDRASYGWPQSLGCVEMPPAHAEVVYPMTPLGTVVTVQ